MRSVEARSFEGLRILVDCTRILTVFALCLAVYLGYSFFRATPKISISMDSVPSAEVNQPAFLEAPEAQDFRAYVSILNQRDIFKSPYSAAAALQSRTDTASATGEAGDINITRDYKLVGIVLDKEPKAVIENVSTQETLFFSVGENIDGIILEDLQEGKAIFAFNGKRFELEP